MCGDEGVIRPILTTAHKEQQFVSLMSGDCWGYIVRHIFPNISLSWCYLLIGYFLKIIIIVNKSEILYNLLISPSS